VKSGRAAGQGWLPGARRVPSPNCDARPGGQPVTLLVVHCISLPPGKVGGDAIERFFTNRLDANADPYFKEIHSMKVSAHFVVRRDGELLQFVPLGKRAWHAGVSSWRGRTRCNDFSVGVELEGTDESDYAPAQYARLRELVHVLRKTVPLRDVAAHSDVAPGRKSDPGARFDWARLLAAVSQI
jgi:AmpD protein